MRAMAVTDVASNVMLVSLAMLVARACAKVLSVRASPTEAAKEFASFSPISLKEACTASTTLQVRFDSSN